MRTSKFTVEQISHALRRAEGGVAVAEISRERGEPATEDRSRRPDARPHRAAGGAAKQVVGRPSAAR